MAGRVVFAAVSILTIASLAACGSGRPTLRATDRPATPAVTDIAATASVLPTPNCGSGDGRASDAILTISTLGSIEEIDLDAADGLPTVVPAASLDPNEVPVVGSVLGGTPIETILFASDGSSARPSITSVTADFIPFGSGAALPVDADIEGAQALLRLPDADARGTLRIAVAWTSACGAAEAAGEITLQVLDSSVAEGCPTSEGELVDAVTALHDETFLYGTLAVPLEIVSWGGRWIPASGETDVPQFEPWVRDGIVESAPGAAVVVRHAVEDLQLLSVRTWIYERAVVEAYLEPDSSTELSTYGSDRTNAGSRGRVNVPAPLELGSYVFESQATWQTPCLNLVTYSVVSVAVR